MSYESVHHGLVSVDVITTKMNVNTTATPYAAADGGSADISMRRRYVIFAAIVC